MVSLTKGIEQGTLARMSQVVARRAPRDRPRRDRGAHRTEPRARDRRGSAHRVGRGHAATRDVGAQLQQLFMTPTFRVYTNPDVVGCEIAGATKNVIAIAVGAAAGLRVRRQRARGAHHARARGDDPARRRARWRPADLRRARGSRRPRRDVHERPEPQPARRLRVRARVARSRRSSATRRWWPRGCAPRAESSSWPAHHGVELPIAEMVSGGDRRSRGTGRLPRHVHGPGGQGRARRDPVATVADQLPMISVGYARRRPPTTRRPRGHACTPAGAGWTLEWWIGADDRWRIPANEVAVRQHRVARRRGGGDRDAGAEWRRAPAGLRRRRARAARRRRGRERVAGAVRARVRGPRAPRGSASTRARTRIDTAVRAAHGCVRRRGGRGPWPHRCRCRSRPVGAETGPFPGARRIAARASRLPSSIRSRTARRCGWC